MHAKARIVEHPSHPMLNAFPIAFYTATIGALLVYLGTADPFWYRAALTANLGGLVMTAIAAIPGLIDLINLPPGSKARTTGLRHLGFNVNAMIVFACSAAILYRNYYDAATDHLDAAAPLALGVVGLLSVMAAWLGRTRAGVTSSHRAEAEEIDERTTPRCNTARFVIS
jgi:uncharacterized membrane protein